MIPLDSPRRFLIIANWAASSSKKRGNTVYSRKYAHQFALHCVVSIISPFPGDVFDIFEVKLTFEMLTVRGQQHSFSTHERVFVLVKVSKLLRQKMSRPEGDSNPQPSDSCRMLQPIELSGPDICCPMFLDTDSGGIDIFEVMLTLEMLTMFYHDVREICRPQPIRIFKLNHAPGRGSMSTTCTGLSK